MSGSLQETESAPRSFREAIAHGVHLTGELANVRPVPEFFPLPKSGRDPWFGLSRSRLYELEREGVIRLVRDRKPGCKQGAVYVPYAEVSAFMHRLLERSAEDREAARNAPRAD